MFANIPPADGALSRDRLHTLEIGKDITLSGNLLKPWPTTDGAIVIEEADSDSGTESAAMDVDGSADTEDS